MLTNAAGLPADSGSACDAHRLWVVDNGPILVVEDDVALGDSVADLLRDRGYAVERAETGAAALARLRDGRRPRLILLDLMMPAMTGWDLLSAVRQDAALDGIPVVVLSGHLLGPARDSALRAHGFVKKPVRIGELLAEVKRHCPG
jgi:two-component system phosphate regulon response regulator PhoB